MGKSERTQARVRTLSSPSAGAASSFMEVGGQKGGDEGVGGVGGRTRECLHLKQPHRVSTRVQLGGLGKAKAGVEAEAAAAAAHKGTRAILLLSSYFHCFWYRFGVVLSSFATPQNKPLPQIF